MNGDPQLRVDVAFPQLKIAVEADGKKWHSDPDSVQKDRNRDSKLAAQGWMVLRFKEEEIGERMQDVIRVIAKAVNQRVQGMGARSAADMVERAVKVGQDNMTTKKRAVGASAWL